jgi:hypothetical protein
VSNVQEVEYAMAVDDGAAVTSGFGDCDVQIGQGPQF